MINVKVIVKNLPKARINDPEWVVKVYDIYSDTIRHLNDEEQDDYNACRYIFNNLMKECFFKDAPSCGQ